MAKRKENKRRRSSTQRSAHILHVGASWRAYSFREEKQEQGISAKEEDKTQIMFSGLLSAGARREAPRNRQALLTSSGIFGNRCTQLSETRRNSELLSAEQPSATGLNQANKPQASNPFPSLAAASLPFALDIRCEVFPYRFIERHRVFILNKNIARHRIRFARRHSV